MSVAILAHVSVSSGSLVLDMAASVVCWRRLHGVLLDARLVLGRCQRMPWHYVALEEVSLLLSQSEAFLTSSSSAPVWKFPGRRRLHTPSSLASAVSFWGRRLWRAQCLSRSHSGILRSVVGFLRRLGVERGVFLGKAVSQGIHAAPRRTRLFALALRSLALRRSVAPPWPSFAEVEEDELRLESVVSASAQFFGSLMCTKAPSPVIRYAAPVHADRVNAALTLQRWWVARSVSVTKSSQPVVFDNLRVGNSASNSDVALWYRFGGSFTPWPWEPARWIRAMGRQTPEYYRRWSICPGCTGRVE